jgi:hypothetical protein
VTDCSGLTLELGDVNIPELGEITFFARGLSQVEMEEIMAAGYTLNDIAVGKAMFAPETTPFDDSRSNTVEGFSDAKNERSSAMTESKKQGSLTRGTIALNLGGGGEVVPPGVNVPNPQCNVRAREEFAAFQNETSCRRMNLTDQDSLLDTTTNKRYFPFSTECFMTRCLTKIFCRTIPFIFRVGATDQPLFQYGGIRGRQKASCPQEGILFQNLQKIKRRSPARGHGQCTLVMEACIHGAVLLTMK